MEGERVKRFHPIAMLVVMLLATLAWASVAHAEPGSPTLEECFYFKSAVSPCSAAGPATEGVDIAISPDGKQAYVLGQAPAMVRIFDRGPGSLLTPRPGPAGCYTFDGSGGACTATPGLVFLNNDLEISPDGKSVYVAAGSNLVNLKRDTSTGTLTPVSCYGTEAGCVAIAPVAQVWSVVVSKDNADVYTQGFNTLGAFQRNPTDGTLVPEPDGPSCYSETAIAGCTDIEGLKGNTYEMDFSPDGKFLYHSIQTPGGIGFFERKPNGSLSRVAGTAGGCITKDGSSTSAGECATVADGSGAALENARGATVSPSGAYVFVSGSGGTVVLARNAGTGALTKVDCVTPSAVTTCTEAKGTVGWNAAISPNGTTAILGSDDVDGIGVFAFDEATGKLKQLPGTAGCFSGAAVLGCGTLPGGGDRTKVAWTGDGFNFYVATEGSLVSMAQDYPPVCQSRSVDVTAGLSAVVPLSCTDPNGDAVTLQIANSPTAGLLAAIDQIESSVRYQPFNGFLGMDSFGYRGVAKSVASDEAKVTLNVKAASAPEGRSGGEKAGEAKPSETPSAKPLKCKKGFRKAKVKGKPKCKKVKKHRKPRHR